MKRTYMVAVQVTIKPTIYVEVIAESAAEALAEVKADKMQMVANCLESFADESRTDLDNIDSTDVKVISCGRASQYHSENECQICTEVANETI